MKPEFDAPGHQRRSNSLKHVDPVHDEVHGIDGATR